MFPWRALQRAAAGFSRQFSTLAGKLKLAAAR
jgi:hypothetical protein